jgi:hypothetical protein
MGSDAAGRILNDSLSRKRMGSARTRKVLPRFILHPSAFILLF